MKEDNQSGFSLSFNIDSKDVKVGSLAIECWRHFRLSISHLTIFPIHLVLLCLYSSFLKNPDHCFIFTAFSELDQCLLLRPGSKLSRRRLLALNENPAGSNVSITAQCNKIYLSLTPVRGIRISSERDN